MGERDFPGMEEVAFVCATASVERVTHYRVAEVFEMHADLVGPAGLRLTLHEGFSKR